MKLVETSDGSVAEAISDLQAWVKKHKPITESKEPVTLINSTYLQRYLSNRDRAEEASIMTFLGLFDIIEHITSADIQTDNSNLMGVAAIAFQLQNAKELSYGRSWCKHGDISAYLNNERKWDRISKLMDKVMKTGVENSECFQDTGDAESLVDTIFDLGCYAFMWVGFILETHPEAGEAFKRGVCRFLTQTEQLHSQ